MDRYYCFSTPELTAAIDSYIGFRKRFGEGINPDSPLIRQFDIKDSWAAKHLVKPLSKRRMIRRSLGSRKSQVSHSLL